MRNIALLILMLFYACASPQHLEDEYPVNEVSNSQNEGEPGSVAVNGDLNSGGASDVGNPGIGALNFTAYSKQELVGTSPLVTFSEVSTAYADFVVNPCENSTAFVQIADPFSVDMLQGNYTLAPSEVSYSFGELCGGKLNFKDEESEVSIVAKGLLADGTAIELYIPKIMGVQFSNTAANIAFDENHPLAMMVGSNLDDWIDEDDLDKAKIEDGKIIIAKKSNQSILAHISTNIRKSFRVHEDKNKNKHLELEDANTILMDQ